jgi:hypothetical protein
MTRSPSPFLRADLTLARTVRARPRGAWRPCWGRIAALGFSLGVWGLLGWAVTALLGVWP